MMMLLCIRHCVLLVLVVSIACPQAINTEQPTLRLLSILPYPDSGNEVQPAFVEGDALYLASELAVELINNRTDILFGYNLELLQADGGCDLVNILELSLFKNIVYGDVKIQGVIGPGCSESTLFLGNQIAQPALEVLSLSLAGSNNLSARDDYKNSFSIIDSSTLYVRAIRAIVRNQKWKNISVLHDLSREFFSSIQLELESEMTETQYHFMSLFPGNLRYTPDHSLPLRCVPTSRVTLLIASASVISELICLFTKEKVFRDKLYPSFQFVIVNRTPESIIQDTTFLYGNSKISCTASEISNRLNGTVFLDYRLSPLDHVATTTTGMSHMQFQTLYKKKVQKYNEISKRNVIPSVWAPAYFDATWALALALNNSREALMESEGLDLSDYRPGLTNATAIVRDSLKRLHFFGVSGSFKLGDNGFVQRYIDIRQFLDGQFRKFEYYDNSTDNIKQEVDARVQYIEWQFIEIVESSSILGGLLISFVILVTTLIVVIHVISILNSRHPSIKATSPKLYHFAYIGIYIQSIGSVIYIVGSTFGVPESVHCDLLHFTVLLNGTGVMLVFAALAAISFRFYRIFVHYLHPGRLIGDGFLLGFIVLVTSVYLVYYSVLTIMYRPTSSVACVSTQGNTLYKSIGCHYPFAQWMIVYQIFPALLSLLALTFSALSIGKVKIEVFRTGSILLVSVFSLCNAGVWTLYNQIQVIGNSTNPSLGPVVGITAFSHLVFLLFLFFPPSLPVIRDYCKAHCKQKDSKTTNNDLEVDIPYMIELSKKRSKEIENKL